MTIKDIEVTSAVQTDYAEFAHYLDGSDIPVDQREEFLALLWSIMVQFAELGFGVDTTSQAIAAIMLGQDDLDKGIELKPDLRRPQNECDRTTRRANPDHQSGGLLPSVLQTPTERGPWPE